MLKTVTAILFFSLSLSSLRAGEIDSLELLITNAKDDSTRINEMIELAMVWAPLNFDSAHYYNDAARKQAQSTKNYYLLARSLNLKGRLYQASGDYSDALTFSLESAKLSEFMGYKKMLAGNYSMIGEVSGLVHPDTKRHEEYFSKALNIYQELNDSVGIAEVYNEMGLFETDTLEAIRLFKLSAKLAVQIDNHFTVADAYHNLAGKYKDLGNYDSSLVYYKKTLEMDLADGGAYNLSISWNSIGEVFMLMKDYRQALIAVNESIRYSTPAGFNPQLKFAYQTKAQVFSQLGQYDSAYACHIMSSRYKDSVLNHATAMSVAEMETRYRTEKKELENIALAEKNARQEDQINEEKRVIWYLAIGILLVLGLGIAIFLGYRRKKSMNAQLSAINDQLNNQNRIIEAKSEEILASISYAKRIQSAILPPDKLVAQFLPKSFIMYIPKDIVAGDFYWMETKEEKILFAAADCTGHGVPGAMVSVICNNGLNRSVREHGLSDPAEILNKTREIVIKEFEKSEDEVKDGMDVSLCCLDPKTNRLTWAGAYNPLWIIRNGSNEIEEQKADKQPIGKYRDSVPFTTHTLELNKGDRLYIFTDGFADQFGGEKGKKYKSANFKRFLLSLKDVAMEDQKERLDSELKSWQGIHEQVDDICIIGVEI